MLAAALFVVLSAAAADGGSSLEPPEVTALGATAAGPGSAALDLDAGHPTDPFSAEYAAPEAREVGVGAGQLRIFALGGLDTSPDLLGEVTVESLHLSFLAVRGTVSAGLSRFAVAHPHLLTARLGLALHLAPYRRVNASLFVDAGLAVADLFAPERRAAPVVVPGAALEVAITAHLFLRAEALFLWTVLPATGPLMQGAGLLGAGWTL